MNDVTKSIKITLLSEMAEKMYGNLVKAVVDIKLNKLVVNVEMHSDAEVYLLKIGSVQSDLWGINLYPNKFGTDEFIEFDSMINIRPRENNMSRMIESEETRRLIINLVNIKVTK